MRLGLPTRGIGEGYCSDSRLGAQASPLSLSQLNRDARRRQGTGGGQGRLGVHDTRCRLSSASRVRARRDRTHGSPRPELRRRRAHCVQCPALARCAEQLRATSPAVGTASASRASSTFWAARCVTAARTAPHASAQPTRAPSAQVGSRVPSPEPACGWLTSHVRPRAFVHSV